MVVWHSRRSARNVGGRSGRLQADLRLSYSMERTGGRRYGHVRSGAGERQRAPSRHRTYSKTHHWRAMFDEFGINAGYVEELHARWQQSPLSVEEGWRLFFEESTAPKSTPASKSPVAHTNGTSTSNGTNGANGTNGTNGVHALATTVSDASGPSTSASYLDAVRESVIAATELQNRVAHLVNAHRVRGHVFADVDPLEAPHGAAPELELSHFGLSSADLDKTFSTAGIGGLAERATLRQIVAHLNETYC